MKITIEKRISRKTDKIYVCLCIGGQPLSFDLLTILRITSIPYASIAEMKAGDVIEIN